MAVVVEDAITVIILFVHGGFVYSDTAFDAGHPVDQRAFIRVHHLPIDALRLVGADMTCS